MHLQKHAFGKKRIFDFALTLKKKNNNNSIGASGHRIPRTTRWADGLSGSTSVRWETFTVFT